MHIFRIAPLFTTATLQVLAAACGGAEPTSTSAPQASPAPVAPTQVVTPPEAAYNFRFLVSDEVNAIDQFQRLDVSISRIGLLQGGESGKWMEMPPQEPTVDLTQLQGENAQVIWSGALPDGQYTKVFVYVDAVTGVLKDDPSQTVEVKLPSSKLQISKSFEVATDTVVSFVYDLTVIAAGNPQRGVKYILKPQIGESGSDQRFKEIKPEKATKGPEVKGELAFQLEGDVVPGGTATLTVTHHGTALANVPVELNDDQISVTDATGRLTLEIPADADELDLESELKGKLELEFGAAPPQTPRISGELNLQLNGDATPGATVTLTVTHQETALANVPIELNDEEIGVTDASGQLTLEIPADVQELELEAKLKGEFELKFKEESIESEEFKGTVTTLTEGTDLNSPWTVSISGIQDPVTVPVLELEGTPQVGSEVEVKGVLIEGIIIDAEVEVEENGEDEDEDGDKDNDKGKPETPGRP